ncbi:MAG: pyridoxal-dependent decarboxylase [Bryobacterales bacterium]|nr:pyridoxal-dependent decarboxylase [Bryobacterales bacterium]
MNKTTPHPATADSLSPEEFRKHGHEVVDWIADYLAGQREYSVLPNREPGDLIDALPARGPDEGEAMDAILRDFREQIVPALTHWNHPRFFSYFSVSASAAGILGEMLTAGINTNGMLWQSNPAATELEMLTLGWLREWCGLPDSFFGEIFDTASISTFHALIAARERIAPQTRGQGAPRGLVAYASEYAHSSVEKGAMALGIGQQHHRKIPVDAQFRMRADLLEQEIVEDQRRGYTPFCVTATIGTTSVTSVDPVPEIAAICKRHGLWLHVDAAYAGPVAICPDFRHHFEGWEEADSIVLNPHKWLFTPIDLSVFYIRHPDILRRALSLVPEYLKSAQHPRAVNLMDYGIPLGRRFRALKLWFVMRSFGRLKIEENLRNHIAMAQRLAERIAAHPRFEVTAPTPFSTVCFRLRGEEAANAKLLEAVNKSGVLFLSQTRLGDLYTLRLAIGSVFTTQADVDLAWETILREAEAL